MSNNNKNNKNNNNNKNINNIIIILIINYYRDGSICEVINTHQASHTITNLTEKTKYEICIASIDKEWRTSKYRCQQVGTDVSITGPVEQLIGHAMNDSISISWNKPSYEFDDPDEYIVSNG